MGTTQTPYLDLALARWLAQADRMILLRVCHALERECFSRGYHMTGKLLADAHKELAQESSPTGRETLR